MSEGIWIVEGIRCWIAPLTLGKGNVGVYRSTVTYVACGLNRCTFPLFYD